MSVRINDYSLKVLQAIDDKAETFLYDCGELLKGQAAQITPVMTGQLKGSWEYKVDLGEKEVTVGSPLENAIWNELGTGEYAAEGNGRKGGWAYKDESGNWHFTKGKRPRHTLQKTFEVKKNSIINRAKQLFGELGE